MRYIIKGSKPGANENREASTLADAFDLLAELAGRGFFVNLVDAETGAHIDDETLVDAMEAQGFSYRTRAHEQPRD